MKEGPAEDYTNRERIAGLLRFASTHNDDDSQNVSLADYISRMKEGQKAIYYITADSFNAARHSPHLEVFRKKDIEVLLLFDRVDEWLVSSLTEFDGKPLQSIAKGELDLGDLEDKEEKKQQKKIAREFKDLVKRVTTVLGDRVKEVRLTHRLTESPACLVSEAHDMGANLERILKEAGQEIPGSKPVLELNPEHPLVLKLRDEKPGKRFDDWVEVLFDQALLAEGGQLDDPATFVGRLNALLLELSK